MSNKPIVHLRSDYDISSPPPGIGTPEFDEADAQASVLIIASRAGFDIRTLWTIAHQLSPLALRIVLWTRNELDAARIQAEEKSARARSNSDEWSAYLQGDYSSPPPTAALTPGASIESPPPKRRHSDWGRK